MRIFIATTLICFCTSLVAGIDPHALRRQIYGDFVKDTNFVTHVFKTNELVAFENGYSITKDEFYYNWNRAKRPDSSLSAKTKVLNEMIASYQKVFEGFDQCLDTATSFQLEFLKFKQERLTPYLDKGYSRVEAEALPEFKYFLRWYYNGMVIFNVVNKEVWAKAAMDESALRRFYNDHIGLYQGQTFEISRTKVIHDYQLELDKKLIERVQIKFPYKINDALLNEL